jgi:hypothetical protein
MNPTDQRLARVARQSDGAVLLIVRDQGIRVLTEQLPPADPQSPQRTLERASAVLERRGMHLSRPWTRHPSGRLDFIAPWQRDYPSKGWQ